MGVVPAEFRGMARAFRAEMLERDRDLDCAINAITAPIKRRLRTKPTLRPAMVTDTIRAWKRLPYQQYRLRPVQVLREDEHELEIVSSALLPGDY